MYTTSLMLTSILTLTATAIPLNSTEPGIVSRKTHHKHLDTFKLHVWNNCGFEKEVALYSVTKDFKMLQRSRPATIPPKGLHIIHAPFHASGMRLSGHAEWGTAGQWQPQALFEFGYSTYAGQDGTAYDLSLMPGSDSNIGMGVYLLPNGYGSDSCKDQTCFPWDCPLDQGWTNPDQVNDGSPADTVCYKGKTDFKIVYCP